MPPYTAPRAEGKTGLAIGNYGVVKGKAIAGRPGSRPGDHYLVHVVAERMSFRFSINVKSRQRPHELLYLLSDDYRHPILAELAALSPGFHRLRGRRHPLTADCWNWKFAICSGETL